MATKNTKHLMTSEALTAAIAARKFLADYCVKCHGPEKQKGDVRLD